MTSPEFEEDKTDLEDEIGSAEIAETPNDAADSPLIVQSKVPKDILELYEIHSYRNAAVILSETRAQEFAEICDALRKFRITTTMIRKAGGNESEIPKLFSSVLRPNQWHETVVRGDLVVRLFWKEQVASTKGKVKFEKRESKRIRERFLDGHKIDYVKNRVAFDLEWNSKDQTFDRDLYAFSAFAQCGVVDVAVLVTRSKQLDVVFKALGPALKKNGTIEYKSSGIPRRTMEKYGASTTWMGKLLYRLNAGRNGGCPVLAVGITPKCIVDWPYLGQLE